MDKIRWRWPVRNINSKFKKLIVVSVLLLLVNFVIIIRLNTMPKPKKEPEAPISDKEDSDLFDNDDEAITFSDIKNYSEKNLERYEAYKKLNPDLLEANIIWKVNMGLDLDNYSDIHILEKPDYYLSIVNHNFALSKDYVPQDLVKLENVEKDLEVRFEVNQMFQEMKAAIEGKDLSIEVMEAYQSYSQLEDNDEAIRAGHSEHQLGLAIDIYDPQNREVEFKKTELYEWLKQNANRYGFVIRYDDNFDILGYENNSQHLRFVGVEAAIDMSEKNISVLEEYVNKHTDIY